MYLLDTNVISELRKVGDGKADVHVMAWLDAVDAASLYLSSISMMELEIGVLRIERRDADQGALLRTWLEQHVIPVFDGRILPIDADIARCCARLHVPNPCSERDALIAATAITHNMTVATRNTSDFEATGVALLNPWETAQ